MILKNNRLKTYSLILIFVGIIAWSVSDVLPRYMENVENFRWGFLFYRGLGMISTLILFQLIIFKINFVKNIKKVTLPEWIGGVFLGLGMVFFIFGITNTTVATFMFMYALGPLITALVGWLVLKERIKWTTFVSITFAFLGSMVIIGDSFILDSVLGVFFSFLSMLGFCICTVCIRWKNSGAKSQHPIVAGYVVVVSSVVFMLINSINVLELSTINILLSVAHGVLTNTGFLMFSIGARYFLSAELVLFAQLEIILSILLSVIPWFGINETISNLTLTGGLVILSAIVFYALTMPKQKNIID